MFSHSAKKLDNAATATVIGEELKIDGGIIRGKGNIRVDGELTAQIDIDGSIVVGETGRITGDVSVIHSLVAGKIEGNLVCSGTLHLSPTADFSGNITVGAIIIDEGAKFSGNCQMMNAQTVPSKSRANIVELEIAE
ncbi:MAG: polymer-forming cytoskeletal protein [Clostridiales bacterium]|jgi:cytoskeletal protein CcmA (bactofilin family)|nr:polymer-forming cytoskeletal protein [Clostridiales bacterium]